MKGSKLVLFFIFILFFACTEDPIEPDQAGSISGQVMDASTFAPIVGASVTTTPASNSVDSDDTGNFVIEELTPGTYNIKVVKTGYKTSSVSVEVKSGSVATASIQMTESSQTNDAPNTPSGPTPVNGATSQSVDITLVWHGSDPNSGDTLTYDVYLGDGGPMQKVAADQADSTFQLDDLDYNSTYHWQIVARDQEGAVTYGPAWSFTTKTFPSYHIVFASNVSSNYDIFTGPVTGTDSIRLTDDPGKDWYPKFSPDRSKIAFSSNRDVESHIYVMGYDGTDMKKITSLPIAGYHNYGTGFCWDNTGHKLLYANYDGLYRIDSDGDGLTRIATAPADRNFLDLDWSPMGNKIAAVTVASDIYTNELYIMDSNGGNMQMLIGDDPGRMGHPSFSPNGDKLAYYYDVSGHESSTGRMLDARIHIIDIALTDTTDISAGKSVGTNDIDPVWAPDGAHIIFTNVANDGSATPSVWIMDINGNNRQKLFNNAQMPDWK